MTLGVTERPPRMERRRALAAGFGGFHKFVAHCTTWARSRSSSPTMSPNGNRSTVLTRRRPSIDIVDAKVAVDLATSQTYSENVFLFVPNLIGLSPLSSFATMHSCARAFFFDRVHAYYFGCSVSPLHELPPEILHSALLYLVLT